MVLSHSVRWKAKAALLKLGQLKQTGDGASPLDGRAQGATLAQDHRPPVLS